jgi:hypothetical protein
MAAYLVEGQLRLAQHKFAQALQVAQAGLAYAHKIGDKQFFPWLAWVQGEALRELGRWDESEAILVTALHQVQEMEARPALWRILAALSKLAALQGHRSESETWRQQAGAVIEWIGRTIAEPALRDAFWSQPAVRAVRVNA